jgi:hypothetical protein
VYIYCWLQHLFHSPQDLMDFLNPNGSDCTLVLFYTPWCRFSASLAPHFNSLPRAFPALHFLALDASQHSRYLPWWGCHSFFWLMIVVLYSSVRSRGVGHGWENIADLQTSEGLGCYFPEAPNEIGLFSLW